MSKFEEFEKAVKDLQGENGYWAWRAERTLWLMSGDPEAPADLRTQARMAAKAAKQLRLQTRWGVRELVDSWAMGDSNQPSHPDTVRESRLICQMANSSTSSEVLGALAGKGRAMLRTVDLKGSGLKLLRLVVSNPASQGCPWLAGVQADIRLGDEYFKYRDF